MNFETIFQWIGVIIASLLSILVAAKTIAAMTKTKRDDEIIAKIESILRKIESSSDSFKPGGGTEKRVVSDGAKPPEILKK